MIRCKKDQGVKLKSPDGKISEPTIECQIAKYLHGDGVSGKPYLVWQRDGDSLFYKTSITDLWKHFIYTEDQYEDFMRWMNIYENQHYAAKQVLSCFDVGMKEIVLMAEMQSGKSGTIRYIVHSLLHTSGDTDTQMSKHSVYFICGLNDNDLRAQAISEFAGFIPEQNILFSSQLQQWNQEDGPTEISLVIVDESHYASKINSQIDKFMSNLRRRNWSTDDIYVLSVSATAMAEIATSEAHCKGCVYLRPGDGYYGIRDLFANGLISQSVDMTHNGDDFVDLVVQWAVEQEWDPKYNIVRLPSLWYRVDLELAITELSLDIDIHFISHHSTEATVTDFNEYLKDAPKAVTIIWIYNSLRAGKQLNTTHVKNVHDTAYSTPDTIAQSLLGRILGYNKMRHEVNCYTDLSAAKLFLDWITHLYDPRYIPVRSRDVANGHSDRITSWNLHVPLYVQLPDSERKYYRYLKQLHGNRYPYKDILFDAIIDAADINQAEVTRVLLDYKASRCGGVTVITEHNAASTYKDHWCHNWNSYVVGDPVRGFVTAGKGIVGVTNLYHVFVNLHLDSPQYGAVLITYKEYIDGEREATAVRVSSKSRFAIKEGSD